PASVVGPALRHVGSSPSAAVRRLAPARRSARPRKETEDALTAGAATHGSQRDGRAPRRRVALLSGCVASVLSPHINAAAARVLTRQGIDVVTVEGEGCCGPLMHHLGRAEQAPPQPP